MEPDDLRVRPTMQNLIQEPNHDNLLPDQVGQYHDANDHHWRDLDSHD